MLQDKRSNSSEAAVFEAEDGLCGVDSLPPATVLWSRRGPSLEDTHRTI